jgi:hypothetical protein
MTRGLDLQNLRQINLPQLSTRKLDGQSLLAFSPFHEQSCYVTPLFATTMLSAISSSSNPSPRYWQANIPPML